MENTILNDWDPILDGFLVEFHRDKKENHKTYYYTLEVTPEISIMVSGTIKDDSIDFVDQCVEISVGGNFELLPTVRTKEKIFRLASLLSGNTIASFEKKESHASN